VTVVLVALSTLSPYLFVLCVASMGVFLKSGFIVFQSLRECKRIANSV
jgi:hypothetical protein